MKHSFFFLFISFLITFSQYAYSDILRVGVAASYPPVIFKHEGKIVGIEASLAIEVAQLTGKTLQLIEIPWKNLEQSLNKGDIDVVMSGVSVTDERKKRVDFCQPYMTVGQMVLVKADNIMNLASKVSMYSAGRRFGVEKNTTGEKYANAEFAASKITAFDSVKQGIQSLKSGDIDYFIHDAPTIWQYTVLPRTQDESLFGLYEYMTEEPLAWAVKKGNTKLLEQLNSALKSMQSKGIVNNIVEQWIPLKIEVGNT